MDLVLDFGNTNKKLALFQKGTIAEVEFFPEIDLTLIREFVKLHPGIENCILSSVISYPKSIHHFLRDHFHFIELNETTPLPIKNLYKTPATLGKDRLAAAAGGWSLFPGEPVLVINAGTCITYDLINTVAEYLGGAISPGMEMRFRALHTFTGKLPLISYKNPGNLTGNDTEHSILSGVMHGITGEIEQFIHRYSDEYPGLKVIISGGDLKYFDKQLKVSIFAVPNIVLLGLHQILEFNASQIP